MPEPALAWALPRRTAVFVPVGEWAHSATRITALLPLRPVDLSEWRFEAHPVTKERWPDLVELFDRPIVRTRFCMFYRKTRTGTGVGLENRQAMKALVDRGTVPGLIGYENGVPVAWVSLGPREDYA